MLWSLQAPGLPTSYLFGTVHLSDERILNLPAPVLRAFDASQRCLFELIVPQDGYTLTVTRMLLSHGLYLQDVIGDEAFNKVVVAAGRYGIPTAAIGRMRPEALMLAFQSPPSEWQRRLRGWAFLDLALQNEARAVGKPIYALETIGEHLALDPFRNSPNVGLLLEGMVENSFRMERDMEALVRYYLRRDLDAMFSAEEGRIALLPEAERAAHAAYMLLLRDVRNEAMVQRMLPHLRAASSFVAVGAAHLPGKTGMLHLLELQGFRVTRLH